jgi:hypothetical protein
MRESSFLVCEHRKEPNGTYSRNLDEDGVQVDERGKYKLPTPIRIENTPDSDYYVPMPGRSLVSHKLKIPDSLSYLHPKLRPEQSEYEKFFRY